jgi:serine/threonine-protein kinase
MGEVVEARHAALDRLVVIKLIHPQFAGQCEFVDRMRFEAQALARLYHPNIVTVLDFATTLDGRPYLVMERLQGHTLKEELRERGKLPWREAIDFTSQALAGLRAVHAAGMVHRDVKLDNLFVCDGPDGARQLKLLDFGIAKALGGQGEGHAPLPLAIPTEEGVTIGSPLFFSPEQALGKGVDHRTDIYAVGVVLYMLLTGDGPFPDAQSFGALLRAHVFQRPVSPRVMAPAKIASDLERAVLKALAKSPEDRFASAAEFEAELLRIGALPAPLGWLETQPLAVERPVARAAHPWDRSSLPAIHGTHRALASPVPTLRLERPSSAAAPIRFPVLLPQQRKPAPSVASRVKLRLIGLLVLWIAVTLAALSVILYWTWV